MKYRKDHRRKLLLICLLASSAAGCNWLKPLAFILPEPKETIPAEFAHLQGTATVLVWARPETLYDYPNARLEVASHVVDQVQAHVRGVEFADTFAVEDYLERNSSRLADPERLGREFGTRFVIYLELLEFATRDPHMPDLLQGRIRSSAVVYDLKEKGLPPKRFELAPIYVAVPEGQPVRFTQARALHIRKAMYEIFAGTLAKKFYDHKEIIK